MPSHTGICSYDGKSRILYLSKPVGKFTEDGFLGRPVWYRARDETYVRQGFAECLLTGQPITMESEHFDEDGVPHRFNYVFYPLPDGLDHRVIAVWAHPRQGERLSAQEKNCLRMLADGLHQHAIAERLFVCDGTVKTALFRARSKLGAATNTQAAVLAARCGLL